MVVWRSRFGRYAVLRLQEGNMKRQGDLIVVYNQNPGAGRSVAVDELKLWNFAKSDFSDSLQ